MLETGSVIACFCVDAEGRKPLGSAQLDLDFSPPGIVRFVTWAVSENDLLRLVETDKKELVLWVGGLDEISEFAEPRYTPGTRSASTPDASWTVELFHQLAFFILNCKPISYCRFKRIDVYIP